MINTERMLTSNQVMLRTVIAVMREEPPVIVDWLPWNHTFGGNHNVGLVLYNGGSLYIDGGRPTPDGIAETVRNLREIAPTIYFNVPKGFEMLLPHLRADRQLREELLQPAEAQLLRRRRPAGADLAGARRDRGRRPAASASSC